MLQVVGSLNFYYKGYMVFRFLAPFFAIYLCILTTYIFIGLDKILEMNILNYTTPTLYIYIYINNPPICTFSNFICIKKVYTSEICYYYL